MIRVCYLVPIIVFITFTGILYRENMTEKIVKTIPKGRTGTVRIGSVRTENSNRKYTAAEPAALIEILT